jgi:N-acetyl-anhydromuramyl-L-alanine amidase AmpD
MREIERVVIHCSATEAGVDHSVDEIREWHKARGFRDIGYHFVIHLDGRIERGRPWDQPGAHAKGYNETSIGICYIGGLRYCKPWDTRTVAQIYSLRACVEMLKAQYPMIQVVGHRDLSVDLNGDGVITKDEWMKECPCFNMSDL